MNPDPQIRNRTAIKSIAARARIHWPEGTFDAKKEAQNLDFPDFDALGMVVPSPCISVCQMDGGSGLCNGCFRTIDEILAWGNAGSAARLVVWQAIMQRADPPS